MSLSGSASTYQDTNIHESVQNQHCFSFSFLSVFKIEVCVDLAAMAASITGYAAGVQIFQCKINAENPCCEVGGSALGFKLLAKVCFQTNPLAIIIDAEGCIPFGGCKKFHYEIPLAGLEVA